MQLLPQTGLKEWIYKNSSMHSVYIVSFHRVLMEQKKVWKQSDLIKRYPLYMHILTNNEINPFKNEHNGMQWLNALLAHYFCQSTCILSSMLTCHMCFFSFSQCHRIEKPNNYPNWFENPLRQDLSKYTSNLKWYDMNTPFWRYVCFVSHVISDFITSALCLCKTPNRFSYAEMVWYEALHIGHQQC